MTTTSHRTSVHSLDVVHSAVAFRFPLVAHGRPLCDNLEGRIRYLRSLAHTTSSRGDEGHRLTQAAQCLNVAALIASDCGLGDLARQLCWRQFDCFPTSRPCTASIAKLLLQPLINLGRLLIRAGDGAHAYHLLEAVHTALVSRSSAVIDGRTISLTDLTSTAEEHDEICHWMQAVFLADGTRALVHAGQWDTAFTHAKQLECIGTHLHEGRQIAIITRCAADDTDGALHILDGSSTSTPWEAAVSTCLRVLCLSAGGRSAHPHLTTLAQTYSELEPTPQHIVLRVRLGLCMIDLADSATASQIIDIALSDVLRTPDAYAAENLLTHTACRSRMTKTEKQSLDSIIQDSGLGRGAIPSPLLDELMDSVKESEANLTDLLRRSWISRR